MRNKAFKIGKGRKYDGYQRGLALMVYKIYDKKTSTNGIKSISNQQLEDKLHKPIIKKFKKRRVNSSFKDNIWKADLADMQLLSKRNKEVRFLLSVIDIFNKHVWVALLKDRKGTSIANAFKVILNNSKRKPTKSGLVKAVNSLTILLKNA